MEIILIYLTIHIIWVLMRPLPNNILGCGLVGFCPNGTGKANISYLQLIATFNASRGTDSCGVFINNNIEKGIDKYSDIRDYMMNNRIAYKTNCKNKVVLMHARKSTRGLSTYNNAHPFEIYDENTESSLVGIHNGTITNCFDLAKKYKTPYTYNDVDSKFIFTVLQDTKNYEVLADYEGAAALIFTYKEEPNVLYVFKGASKQFKHSEIAEERPLFFLTKPEGIYISSMIEPLYIINNGRNDELVQKFSSNMVIRIENNTLKNVSDIDRSKPYSHPVAKYASALPVHPRSTYAGGDSIGFQMQMYSEMEDEENRRIFQGDGGNEKPNKYKLRVYPITNSAIYSEVTTAKDHAVVVDDTVYYLAGRYLIFNKYKNYTKRATGLDSTIQMINECYLHGWHYVWMDHYDNYKVSVQRPDSRYAKNIFHCFFFKGIHISYGRIKEFHSKGMSSKLLDLQNKNLEEFYRQLSSYSEYPILKNYHEFRRDSETDVEYYYRGRAYSGSAVFNPPFCFRSYEFREGNVVEISSVIINDHILDPESSETLQYGTKEDMQNNEETVDLTENEKVVCYLSDNSYLSRSIHKSSPYESQVCEAELNDGLEKTQLYNLNIFGQTGRGPSVYKGEDVIDKVLEIVCREYLEENEDFSYPDIETSEIMLSMAVDTMVMEAKKNKEGILDYITHKIGNQNAFEVALHDYLSDEVESELEAIEDEIASINSEKEFINTPTYD